MQLPTRKGKEAPLLAPSYADQEVCFARYRSTAGRENRGSSDREKRDTDPGTSLRSALRLIGGSGLRLDADRRGTPRSSSPTRGEI